MLVILVIAGILIIAGLAWYAWSLTRQVRDVEEKQRQEAVAAEQSLRNHHESMIKDIRFIAQSVLTDQCEITEGILRLNYLITRLDPVIWQQQELSTLRVFYQHAADMPILDAYQALSRKEQFKLDKQRWNLEMQHKNGIFQELEWLMAYRFPTITTIH